MNQTVAAKEKHPKGLYVLFITEMWERFSYYGMRALFILFMAKALLFDKALGSQIYGSYTGLVYLTPLIGGYVADRYWGNRKSIIIGGLLMAAGQFMMFLAGSMYQNIGSASLFMYIGLAFLIFGNGFFKPNISTMVGQLYPKGDKRIDSAFTIFYMGINLGAFVAPLLCGYLGDTGSPADFKWGFLAACIGMLLSVILFIWLKNHYIVTPEGEQIGVLPNSARQSVETDSNGKPTASFPKKLFYIWGAILIAIFCLFKIVLDFDFIGSTIFSLSISVMGLIISDPSLSKIERERIWVIYIACFFVIFFWSAFEQAGASLTYFAEEQTQRQVGWHFSYPVVLVIVGLIAAFLIWLSYRVYSTMKGEVKGLKELILLLLISAAIICIYGIIKTPYDGINYDTIPASYFQSVNAVAIVIFAPLFAILWTALGKRNLEPASPFKQAMGLFLLAVGYLLIAFGVKGMEPGIKVSMMWLMALYTIHTFGELCLSPIGLSMVNKLAPVKFASLLMGVYFLANATANKFAGELSGLYPEPIVPIEVVQKVNSEHNINLLKDNAKTEDYLGKKVYSSEMIDYSKIKDENDKKSVIVEIERSSIVKAKSFVGFKIENLYNFFMIFVFMAGIASVVLFIIAKWMVKMMHGVR